MPRRSHLASAKAPCSHMSVSGPRRSWSLNPAPTSLTAPPTSVAHQALKGSGGAHFVHLAAVFAARFHHGLCGGQRGAVEAARGQRKHRRRDGAEGSRGRPGRHTVGPTGLSGRSRGAGGVSGLGPRQRDTWSRIRDRLRNDSDGMSDGATQAKRMRLARSSAAMAAGAPPKWRLNSRLNCEALS
jgi:hypothetical protein